MYRRFALLFVFALAVASSARAEAPLPDGKWLLTSIGSPLIESKVMILDIETKDNKTTAKILALPGKQTVVIKDSKITDKEIRITFGNGLTFHAEIGADKSTIRGAYGNESRYGRAKLAPTDMDHIAANEVITRTVPPATYKEVTDLNVKPILLQQQIRTEKDAEKKKELQTKLAEAQKEAAEKVPGLLRKTVEESSNTLAGATAANQLLTSATKWKVEKPEAEKLVKIIQTESKLYGSLFERFTTFSLANTLSNQKGLETLALEVAVPLTKSLSDKDPTSFQVSVLDTYKSILEANGKKQELAEIEARLTKLETLLDQEYLATVPPFKPATYSGRKNSEANQVVMMELFTGAQCPPCVAADVAFDALHKTYKHSELVLVQYHMHIPGPDPLTNTDTIARWDYYRKTIGADKVRGTPTTIFNGVSKAGGGGGMANSESKYKQYRDIIDEILEEKTPVKLTGHAVRTGSGISINLDVSGVDPAESLKLRTLVVEDVVKYVGGNKLRFHHQVVRSMPGGAAGFEIKEKNFKHEVKADVSTIRQGLTKYLDDFVAGGSSFANKTRPLDMKDLKVIAFIQDDNTGKVLQAVELPLDDHASATLETTRK